MIMLREKTEGFQDRLRRAFWAVLSAVLALTALAPLQAVASDADPSNDSDSFTIRIIPQIDMGVEVSTAGANWSGPSTDLDTTMEMGTTLLLESWISVSILGDFNNQELDLAGSPNDTWTLDTDASDEVDKLRLYGLFGQFDETTPASPEAADFADDTHLITAATRKVGQQQADESAGDTGKQFEMLSADPQYRDMDGMEVGTTRLLWLRADTPSQTSVDTQQGFTVTVTARTGAGQ